MTGELKRKPKKGFIEVYRRKNELPEQIEILYFPTEYSIEKSNSFSEISVPGLESPYLQYVKGNASTITLEVFYDTYEKYDEKGHNIDVRKYTNQLSNLMDIDPDLHAPPYLRFIWGMPSKKEPSSKEPFYCVLERVTTRFTMFNSDGIPVRARLNITLKEIKLELNVREKSLQSADRTKSYIVKQGDILWCIAAREYGNPCLWRHIADANNICDPKRLKSGTKLVILPLE